MSERGEAGKELRGRHGPLCGEDQWHQLHVCVFGGDNRGGMRRTLQAKAESGGRLERDDRPQRHER